MSKKRTFTMTEEQFRAHENDDMGLCTTCGEKRDCCEPDARNYQCEECGNLTVFGMAELLIMDLIVII